MKKIIKIILLFCFLFCILLGSAYLRGQISAQGIRAEELTAQFPLENPAPPLAKDLAQYGLEPFISELPVLMLDTKDQQVLKETTIWGEAAVLDDPSGCNDIYATPQAVLTAAVKYRGASSYYVFDKAQYRIKFFDKVDGKALNYDLFGLGADSEWVLNGPFLDRTLLRNYLVYTLAGEAMEWAPSCRFFELFVDGRYQGVYLAVEPITDGAARLRLSRFGLVSGATPYIIRRDRAGTEDNPIQTYGSLNGYTGNELSISYPGISKLTGAQKAWIIQDISAFEKALYADYFDDPEIGYAAHIDVKSFVDYYLLNEFAMNHDGGVLSTYAYKELGGKLQMCVWDFNNGFNNYQWFILSPDEPLMCKNFWFDRLVQDRAFVDQLLARYQELRGSILSQEHISHILSQGQDTLGDALDRNFAVWGYTFNVKFLSNGGTGIRRDPNNYPQAMEQLESTIQQRLAYMDDSLALLYEGCIN